MAPNVYWNEIIQQVPAQNRLFYISKKKKKNGLGLLDHLDEGKCFLLDLFLITSTWTQPLSSSEQVTTASSPERISFSFAKVFRKCVKCF